MDLQVDELTPGQKRAVGTAACLLVLYGALAAFPKQSVALLASIVVYMALQKPEPDTFVPFFETWFKKEFYPKVSAQMDAELRMRARAQAEQGRILQSIGNSAMGMLARSTKDFQSAVLLAAVMDRNTFIFQDRGPFLSVTVNLGTREKPSKAVFWGLNHHWMLAPYMQIDESATVLGADAVASANR
ncbi:Hypothetical Protein FCC1311_015462 [Hondaea fermentalgiana]|uniref:Uncharacterized protein n=1 Tax=Hondaea fermentalgiana TaxID=2315210 RepID=A0A2R5G6B3_9STRA|nr:Hypothetical Protein FCC1311_015462 [Hondaea fermentalgiana]|eukprot:GBG25328.1 Hypothetical Protein FCC1311_015462 [Hondaea fermentalgiana]